MVRSPRQKLTDGLISGALATIPMTIAMTIMQQLSKCERRRPLPPHEIVHHLAEDVGVPHQPYEDRVVFAAAVAHAAFGAFCGAAYAALPKSPSVPSTLQGIGFGAAVWAANYVGLLPAVGWHAPPSRTSSHRTTLLIVSHLAWGATTAVVLDRLQAGRGAADKTRGLGLGA